MFTKPMTDAEIAEALAWLSNSPYCGINLGLFRKPVYTRSKELEQKHAKERKAS